MIKLLIALFLLAACSVYADEIDIHRLVDSIYQAEGGSKTQYPYGIKSIECDPDSARQVCINTIRNNYKRWKEQTCSWQEQGCRSDDFLIYLAHKYCPDDWENWAKNVRWFYNK